MRTTRHDPIAIPLGHIQQPAPRVSREVSALLAADVSHDVAADCEALDQRRLNIPAVIRRSADELHARKVQAAHTFLVEHCEIDDMDIANALVRVIGSVR